MENISIISARLPTNPREEHEILYSNPSLHLRGGYNHNQKVKHMALSFWTFLQCKLGCSGKSYFIILRLYDLKLSFQIKDASTDFYEHRQKLLQPWCPHPPAPKNYPCEPTVVAMEGYLFLRQQRISKY